MTQALPLPPEEDDEYESRSMGIESQPYPDVEVQLAELEDTVSGLCDQVGIPSTDDSTPLSRLLQLQAALTSAQAQSGADPQMMLGSLAAVLLGLFDLLGVPVSTSEPPRGLTLQERVGLAHQAVMRLQSELDVRRSVPLPRSITVDDPPNTPSTEPAPRWGPPGFVQAEMALRLDAARAEMSAASEEERQHLTAQLQQARTSVDAWTIECSRLAGQVTDLQARLAEAVEDAGSGVQARVAHALRTELNQVGILMSQGYLSPEMHAAAARVHWLMDLYHGSR